MQKVLSILQDIRPEFSFAESNDFIAEGMLDSFDVVTLVAELDKAFSISIQGTDIVPENFRSMESLRTLLQQYGVNE